MSKPERVAERTFVTKARKRWDAECIKLQTLGPYGMVGRGDRLVLLPYGTVLCLEFKRIGKDLTKLQKHYRKRFKKLGIKVHGVHTAQEAIEICEEAIRAHRILTSALPKGKHSTRPKQASGRVLSRTRVR